MLRAGRANTTHLSLTESEKEPAERQIGHFEHPMSEVEVWGRASSKSPLSANSGLERTCAVHRWTFQALQSRTRASQFLTWTRV